MSLQLQARRDGEISNGGPMALNEQKGNMYEFVTHTWNTIKGKCPHECSYCYMKRWGAQTAVRFDEKELRTDLGIGNFIFVGSSCDMFASEIPREWIQKTIEKCRTFEGNRYLFQSKNPAAICPLPNDSILCTTLETNRFYPGIMAKSPTPQDRAVSMTELWGIRRFITIEPIMDFDLAPFVELIKQCEPEQVNIGADSGGNNLPEPSKGKIITLIEELKTFTHVKNKRNLDRILRVNGIDHQ